MQQHQEIGEGVAVLILLAITFLIVIYRSYSSNIKPCGSFSEHDYSIKAVPRRCNK
jgi:hypothetical protein